MKHLTKKEFDALPDDEKIIVRLQGWNPLEAFFSEVERKSGSTLTQKMKNRLAKEWQRLGAIK